MSVIESTLRNGECLIYIQSFRYIQRLSEVMTFVLECVRILPCIVVSSVTTSAPPVTILFDGIISRLEVLACSPPAIQRFDLDSCIHFLCLYVIC